MRLPFPSRLAALACGTAVFGAAQAQSPSQVQIYGTLDLAVGQIETQPPGPPDAPIVTDRGIHSGALQTSYIGFRGTEDLGGGLVARFQIESFLRADTGQNGRFDAAPNRGGDFFWSRESFVGLGHADFGDLRLGNNVNPTWLALIQTSALGSNSVFSPGFRQLFNGGARGRSEADTAVVNSVRYQSPVWAGVSGSVAVQAGEGSGGKSGYANLGWRSGPAFVTAAVSRIRHAALPDAPGAREQDIALVGATYDFGVVKLFGQYTAIDDDLAGTKSKLPHLGLTVPMGDGVFQLARAEDKTTGAGPTAKRTTTSGGYVHSLSKRTDLYGFVMRDELSVGDADSYAIGMRHRF